MPGTLAHTLATSSRPYARVGRGLRRAVLGFTLPPLHWLFRPVLWAFLAVRGAWHFVYRVLVCEPLFKAQCVRCGRGVRTDVYIHWICGQGDLVVGNNVLMDGKCSITFASRYVPHPTLVIGDGSGIGHGCRFTVAQRITIGRHCRIAADVWMFDSSGHPLDPAMRLAGTTPAAADVKPISIGENVWIGGRAIIHPGVTIGDHSVVSAGAVVMSDVPAHTVVAGNPARTVMNASSQPRAQTGARVPAGRSREEER